MITIGRLARRFGLARSTLLYYDHIDLLHPAGRSEAGYRLYDDEAEARLGQICKLRQAGLELEEIRKVLQSGGSDLIRAMDRRLAQLNETIREARVQQAFLLRILRSEASSEAAEVRDKLGWVALLAAAGLDADDMRRWHVAFERLAPDDHQAFLESIHIPAEEIRQIREGARAHGESR
jgi:MerR family transcriptional regulator, thiopeptide resistance regulator